MPDNTCADCLDAECYLCDGGVWDDVRDLPAICGCWAENHGEAK